MNMEKIKVSIEYEFGINIDYGSISVFNSEFAKLREIVNKDTEKFILSNLDNPDFKKNIKFELEEDN